MANTAKKEPVIILHINRYLEPNLRPFNFKQKLPQQKIKTASKSDRKKYYLDRLLQKTASTTTTTTTSCFFFLQTAFQASTRRCLGRRHKRSDASVQKKGYDDDDDDDVTFYDEEFRRRFFSGSQIFCEILQFFASLSRNESYLMMIFLLLTSDFRPLCAKSSIFED